MDKGTTDDPLTKFRKQFFQLFSLSFFFLQCLWRLLLLSHVKCHKNISNIRQYCRRFSLTLPIFHGAGGSWDASAKSKSSLCLVVDRCVINVNCHFPHARLGGFCTAVDRLFDHWNSFSFLTIFLFHSSGWIYMRYNNASSRKIKLMWSSLWIACEFELSISLMKFDLRPSTWHGTAAPCGNQT